jgi:hypothetical protein
MDTVANALWFWRLVELSLVELYLWEPSAAHKKVLRLRGSMTKAAIAQDVTYHLQPFQVASDIAGAMGPMSDALWNAYKQMENRVSTEPSRNSVSEDEVSGHPHVEVSELLNPLAAFSRS